MRRLALCLLLSCKPDFGNRDSFVDREEVVAVTVDPPEAKPGDVVTFTAFVASPGGPITPAEAWTFCSTPRLLTENGAASPACNTGGTPSGATAALPANGCELFGPEVTSATLRPRDPDETGGFYQPKRVDFAGGSAFGFARLACKLGSVSAATATEFAARYVPNRNPTLIFAPPSEVAAGTTITLRAAWSASDAEPYAYVDRTTDAVVMRREAMRVSWYATGGSFATDRTGRNADDLETFSEDDWTAPTAAGLVHVWVVLRDDRGGTTAKAVAIRVR